MAGHPERVDRHTRDPRARARASVALGLVAALAVTGCTGRGAAVPSAQSTAKGLTVAGEWPLTGLPARGRTPKHPVMVVKIDNTDASSPQRGLSKADLVTEELVEGGLTRLAAFFYQHVSTMVGPVRSMRASDIGIVKPAKAVLVASGGAPPTVRRIKAAGILAFTEGATGYERDGARQVPYNLFVHLDQIARKVKAKQTVPAYLPFGAKNAKVSGRPSHGLDAVFSGGHTTSWTYQGGHYVNQNSFAKIGDRFQPDNVLVLRVQVGDAGYLDPAGNKVPETKLTGTGKALLFHGGQVVRGTWSKRSPASHIALKTARGPLRVPAGHTWVELVPKNGGTVVIRK